MDLHSLLSSRLDNLKRTQGGWTAACPVCRAEGGDGQRNHLRIWQSAAFSCAKHQGERDHNRAIRAFIYQDADPDLVASLDVEVLDPDPKLDIERVYPEEMLTRLVQDHRYWLGRNISEDVLRKLEGGMAPVDEQSKLSGRYIFPVRDAHGRITGFTGRLVNDASFGPKWKHLVRASKAAYPLNVTGEHIRRTRKVCFTEGVGDGLTWGTHGIWNWLILLGLNLNPRVLGFLASANPTHIIISTNSDSERVNKTTGNVTHPGQDAAVKLRNQLIPFFGEERIIIRLPQTAKDWNAADPDEVRAFKAEVEAL